LERGEGGRETSSFASRCPKGRGGFFSGERKGNCLPVSPGKAEPVDKPVEREKRGRKLSLSTSRKESLIFLRGAAAEGKRGVTASYLIRKGVDEIAWGRFSPLIGKR